MTTETSTSPELEVGQPLHIQYEMRGGSASFESAITQIVGERVHISAPPQPLPDMYTGRQVEGIVQIKDAAYHFVTQLLNIDEGYVIESPAELRLMEKRQHYRLQLGLVPSYAALCDEHGVDDRAVRVTVLDLSAGGLQFVSRQAFLPGSLIHMWLPIDDYRVDCVVYVINARTPAKGRSNYRYNGRFTTISTEDRELLARFIFRKQLELRRRQ